MPSIDKWMWFIVEVWLNDGTASNDLALTITTIAERLVKQNVLGINRGKGVQARD
jgi:hypothetical protein